MFIAILRSMVQKNRRGHDNQVLWKSYLHLLLPGAKRKFWVDFFFKHSAVATKKSGLLSCTMILLYYGPSLFQIHSTW